jgi:hypothetical protein
MAGELLFKEALSACERVLRQKAAAKLGFKVNAVITPTMGSRVVRIEPISVKPSGPKKQMVLDSWMADKILVDSLKQKKQKEAKEANGSKSKSPPAARGTSATKSS